MKSTLPSVSKSIVGVTLNLPKASFYAGQYNLEYSTLVLKFDLRLCRVDVHIYDGRVHREIKEIRGNHVPANQAGIGFHDCFMEKVMFHEPVVHEKILFPVSFPGMLGMHTKPLMVTIPVSQLTGVVLY